MATKKKSNKFKVEIKESKEGSFTQWCRSHGFKGVTKECIAKAKKSKSAAIRKKAVFAENAKYKWKKVGRKPKPKTPKLKGGKK